MRRYVLLWPLFVGMLMASSPAYGQSPVNCGSTGAAGPLTVASGTVTLDVPDDGKFHFTTITLTGDVVFRRNTRFNPPVMFLATGDILLNAGGDIRLTGGNATSTAGGLGGPGGFDGGNPGNGGTSPGAGHGPGAGQAGVGTPNGGNAGYGENPAGTHTTNGRAYGSPLLVPLVGGSGGGGDGGIGGGGGGGAILLCSPTQITVNGGVEANGGTGQSTTNSGYGSGGAIRLLAPVVRGSGSLSVFGPSNGGDGRIRVDAFDRTGMSGLSLSGAASTGSFMVIAPTDMPRLDVVRAAGTNVAPGTPSPVIITLPFGSPASQPITVQATGFSGVVPISVVITPESGDRVIVDTEINADAAPAETTVNVDLPQNVPIRVHAWTR